MVNELSDDCGSAELNCLNVGVADVAALIVVTSVALLFAEFVSPPPLTLAVLVTLAGAAAEGLTVRVMAGWRAPGARTPRRVQESVAGAQDQPLPLIDVAVSPVGGVSVTVTPPLVGALPVTFVTVSE